MQNSNKITLWFIAGFLVVVTAGVIIAGALSSGSSNNNPNFTATTAPAITVSDHVTGSTTSTVSLIEYGDFECPACAAYHPVVQQILKDYGSRIEFVFRNFPLYSVHPNASISAQAAEAAALQGKYWEMNDLLYSKQNTWATLPTNQVVSQVFNGFASSLGLDVTKFDSDLNASSVANKIASDLAGGNTAQIDHTPTFFINLKQIPNPQSYDEFKKDLDAALSAPSSSAASSTQQ